MKNEKGVTLISLLLIIIIIFLCIFIFKFIFNNNSGNTKTIILNNELTMENVISKFKEKGLKIELDEEKPLFQLIGAKDGIMFHADGELVKIYEYESEKAYKTALQDHLDDAFYLLKDMPRKNLIVLDTEYQKVIDLFNSL